MNSASLDASTTLNRALEWHNQGWLQAFFIYDDGSTAFNIYGRKAQTIFTRFATKHKQD